MSEILTMENVKSPHTVRLYDAFYGPDLYYLVMEYCPQNLLVYLHDKTQRKGLDEE
jgi:serine/threonine protein kinase